MLGRFVDEQLADEFHVYAAPVLIGGDEAPGPLNARGVAKVADALRLRPTAHFRRIGSGYFLAARLTRA